MRLLLICVLFLLVSCGSFLRSGSRGSLKEATEKSHHEDPEERKVAHDYEIDPEYRYEEEPYTATSHHDYRRDTLNKSSEPFDYSSVAGTPLYKSKTRDRLQQSPTDTVDMVIETTADDSLSSSTRDTTSLIRLDSIDLGIDKSLLKASGNTVTRTEPVRIGRGKELPRKMPPTSSQRIIDTKSKRSAPNLAFGVEADPQLLLSKNFSKAIGGNFLIGGAVDNERSFRKRRHYIFGKLGYHQYRIGSDEELFNEFKWNTLHSFCIGIEYMRYYGAIDNPVAAPYFIANGSYEIVGWDFINPLIDSVSNEEIESDRLGSFSLASGSGVTFMNSFPVRLGLNLTAGLRIYGLKTVEEFDNDSFDPELFLKGAVKLWIDLGFKENKKGPLRK